MWDYEYGGGLQITLRFATYSRPHPEWPRARMVRRSGLIDLVELVETLVCIELLHRAAVAAVVRGQSVHSEFARFATHRAPSGGEPWSEHVRHTFSIGYGNDNPDGRWETGDEMERDARAVAFLGGWVADRFLPGASDPGDHWVRELPVRPSALPLVGVSLDTPWEFVYEVPLDAVAVARGAIRPMVKALERLFDGEDAVCWDSEQFAREFHGRWYPGEWPLPGYGVGVDDRTVLADLAAFEPVGPLRLIAGRLRLVRAGDRVGL